MKNIEILIRKIANHFGIDITRYKADSTESAKLVKMLFHNKVDLILDIGANTGQYANLLRRSGYQGRIVSFEPLQDAWNELQKISQNDAKWEIFPRCAIGSSKSLEIINVSGNSVSSSMLEMLEQHAKAAPDSAYVGTEQVQVMSLDEALEMIPNLPDRIFIKIDTQGYEEKVLDGASASISKAVGVQIELSMVPLYSGQMLFGGITDRLIRQGFEIWSIFPGFTDNDSGRMFQCDAVMFKMQPGKSDA